MQTRKRRPRSSPLDPICAAPLHATAADGYTWSADTEAGGADAEELLNGQFDDLDECALTCSGAYAEARRVVLFSRGRPVAAAIVAVHARLLEVPIFAALEHGCGHGSLLCAVLKTIGRQLGQRLVVVRATRESRAFWARQGFRSHARSWSPAVRTAVQALAKCGVGHSFADSVTMALSLDEVGSGDLVKRAWAHARRRAREKLCAVPADAAAAAAGYEQVGRSFRQDAQGKHVKLEWSAAEQQPDDWAWVPRGALQAFNAGGARGWGVRCTNEIKCGQIVCEVAGRLLTAAEAEAVAEADERFLRRVT